MNPDESSKNLHEGSNILKTMLLICKCQDAEVPKMVNIVNNIPGYHQNAHFVIECIV